MSELSNVLLSHGNTNVSKDLWIKVKSECRFCLNLPFSIFFQGLSTEDGQSGAASARAQKVATVFKERNNALGLALTLYHKMGAMIVLEWQRKRMTVRLKLKAVQVGLGSDWAALGRSTLNHTITKTN